MDEQQMISDILDSIYGYDILLKEGDKDTIALKKKEREEKHKEILAQINSICSSIEKELKNILGTDEIGIKKYIRFNVLKSIKAEIENGNKVIDSNGKINTGKIFDIVNQSKDEILEIIENGQDSLDYSTQEEVEQDENQIDKNVDEFFDELSELGVDLTDEDRERINIAIARVNEILNEIKEKMESGMTEEQAWKAFFAELTEEEFDEVTLQFILAGTANEFNLIRENNKGQSEEEKDGGDTKTEESTFLKEQTPTNIPKNDQNQPRPTIEGFFRYKKEAVSSISHNAQAERKFDGIPMGNAQGYADTVIKILNNDAVIQIIKNSPNFR